MPQPPARTFASPSLDTNPHRRSRSSLKLSPRATSLFPPTSNERICPVAPRAIPLLAPQTNSLLYSMTTPARIVAGEMIRVIVFPLWVCILTVMEREAKGQHGRTHKKQDRASFHAANFDFPAPPCPALLPALVHRSVLATQELRSTSITAHSPGRATAILKGSNKPC